MQILPMSLCGRRGSEWSSMLGNGRMVGLNAVLGKTTMFDNFHHDALSSPQSFVLTVFFCHNKLVFIHKNIVN